MALIDRSDFASATSANSYKMVHGGIRYIQHADVRRVRVSSNERRAFLRVAPHLVRPLPIVVPTFGHGMKGKTAMRMGMALYDLLTPDRSRDLKDPARRVPSCRVASRAEVVELFPGLESSNLTGGAIFCDGQMYNPPRLVLAFVRSAVESGAVAANYVEAIGPLRNGDRIRGVRALDHLSGEQVTLQAKVVLNATGPFAGTLSLGESQTVDRTTPFSRDACFVVQRRLTPPGIGLAIQGATADPDAILSRGERHLFVVPWRGHTLVGVWHKVHLGSPDRMSVSEEELERFVGEVNSASPWLKIDRREVTMVNAGLVPFGKNQPGAANLRYGHRSRLIDHERTEQLQGLITLIGVRFTTGRYEASRAIDLVFKKLGYAPPQCRTAATPVWGGHIENLEETIKTTATRCPSLSPEVVRALVQNYGSAVGEIEAVFSGGPELAETIGNTSTLKAEVIHAVRVEMAEKLADVAYRRTDLATAGLPQAGEIATAADLMATEKGWSEQRRLEEIDEVNRYSLLKRPTT